MRVETQTQTQTQKQASALATARGVTKNNTGTAATERGVANEPGSTTEAPRSVLTLAREERERQAAQRLLTPDEVQSLVDDMQKSLRMTSTKLNFSVDQESGQTIVKVLDASTGEVLRQVPSEDMVHLRASIERMSGVLISILA